MYERARGTSPLGVLSEKTRLKTQEEHPILNPKGQAQEILGPRFLS